MRLEDDPTDHKPQAQNHERLIRWDPPPEGWILLNTDRASKGNPRVIADGGIIRGDRGEWIQGFSENFGVCTLVKAVLKAMLCGLRMARELGLKKIWLQDDLMTIVGMLRGDGL